MIADKIRPIPRVCLAARRQLYDLEIRRGTGQEGAHRLRTHREAPATVLRNVQTPPTITRSNLTSFTTCLDESMRSPRGRPIARADVGGSI